MFLCNFRNFEAKVGPKDIIRSKNLSAFLKWHSKMSLLPAEATSTSIKVKKTTQPIVLCSPFMKRVHKFWRGSSELVLLDTSGGMDRYNNRVGVLLTPSIVGGLPLGVFICTSESEEMLKKALQMLEELYPEDAFFGRGKDGPKIFITDDATQERNALEYMYPLAILLLCLFHVLQAFLRYIKNSDHGIDKSDKLVLYNAFKKVAYADSPEEFESHYNNMIGLSAVKTNKKNLQKHLQVLHSRAKEWALCYREGFITRGNRTSNYVESNFRLIKDVVLERLRAFNAVQLFDFFTTRLNSYYETRINDVLTGRSLHTSKFITPTPDKLKPLSCTKLSDRLFTVKNSQSKKTYTVDLEIDLCTCKIGQSGQSCKHQYFVQKQYNVSSVQFYDRLGEQEKLLFHKIMTGTTENVPVNWYKDLQSVPGGTQSVLAESLELDANEQVERTIDDHDNEPIHDYDDHQLSGQSEVEEWNGKLQDVFARMSAQLKKRPDTYLEPVKAFVKMYNDAEKRGESFLCSALMATKRVSKSGKHINVQSTAVMRRVNTHLGGRKAQSGGRPPKVAGNATLRHVTSGPLDPTAPSKVKNAASHCLSQLAAQL